MLHVHIVASRFLPVPRLGLRAVSCRKNETAYPKGGAGRLTGVTQ